MKVVPSSQFQKVNNPTALAIGSFDGLHKGHQEIINATKEVADKKDACSGVYSFDPHPLEVLAPQKAPSFLLSKRQKEKILDCLGIDYFFEQYFNKEFSRIDFLSFVDDILIEKLNTVHIVVGNDFKFGHKGEGTARELRRLSQDRALDVTIITPLQNGDNKISSTRIRRLIKQGKIKKASKQLGRNYCLEGRVVPGKGRGKKLGFPTANLDLSTNYVLPPRGVYACYVKNNNETFCGIVNFGKKPTFSDENYSVEVHIFDFDKDIYGDVLEVELVEGVREERFFSGSEELVSQIKADILYTKRLLC